MKDLEDVVLTSREGLGLGGLVVRGERGSGGVFVAVRGGLILIWRRFGKIKRSGCPSIEVDQL